MIFLVSAIGILLTTSLLSIILFKKSAASSMVGLIGTLAASVVGLIPSISVFITGTTISKAYNWNMPGGSLSLACDPLSALFLIPLFILSIATALYGKEYIQSKGIRQAFAWFHFNILIASMVMVLLARNGLLFLVAWELMSLSSLLLVLYDHHESQVREAGWIYFVATHAGSAFLIPMFLILERISGSFEISSIALHSITDKTASVIFFLGLIGFGCKAGFMPFHVWLPEAHPAAPSNVSALMSGIMIKMGIYGIFRIITLCDTPPALWGLTILIIGLVSGLLGILFSICQRDIKRLLAYSSVENIGIIGMGMGIGLLGLTYNLPLLIYAGFTGALLHVVNHSLFKGLLFLGAGAVVHATHTRIIESMGGLLKKMPWVGHLFLVGAFSICGLPPFNGFISEFLIFFAGFNGISVINVIPVFCSVALIGTLALIGGLTVASFTRVFGTVFLGESRTDCCDKAHDPGIFMKLPMLLLAICCVIVSISFVYMMRFTNNIIAEIYPLAGSVVQVNQTIQNALWGVLIISGILIVFTLLLLWVRSRLTKNQVADHFGTWDCGYAAPNARMQYSASSFAQPIVYFFRIVLMSKQSSQMENSIFPKSRSFSSEFSDPILVKGFAPLFRLTERFLSKLRWFQGGRVHVYVMYVALAALVSIIVVFAI